MTTQNPPLMLSVSGMRGVIGASLTPENAARFAAAFGHWLFTHGRPDRPQNQPPLVVIGRDSRPSGPMVQRAAVAALIAVGCRVIELDIATTPGVAVMVGQHNADGGMVITASHNPIIWNGLKTLRYDGTAPPADDAKQIIHAFHNDQPTYVDVQKLQPPAFDTTTVDTHTRLVLEQVDVHTIRNAKLKIVVDSVHGAGGPEAAQLAQQLGVQLVPLYPETTGLFPHPPEPTKDHLTELCQAVKHHQAHLGFAQDPDADRLAIVDQTGRYIGEEYTLALCAWRLLERDPDRARGASLAANLSTSRMIDDIAQRYGAHVNRTPVGEANVAASMRQTNALAGGEGNGGIILPEVSFVRDSLAGMALILEMIAQRGQPLSDIVSQTPAYAIHKDKAPASPQLVEQIGPKLKAQYADQRVDQQDGVRVDWPDRWVHVRPSNTEPIVRLIAEAADMQAARKLVDDVAAVLGINSTD